MEFLHKVWHVWKQIGEMIGNFIARFVLTVFYFTLFVPFGLGVRLFSDPLLIKRRQLIWVERSTGDRTLKDARRLS
jgi:hypothetical protein